MLLKQLAQLDIMCRKNQVNIRVLGDVIDVSVCGRDSLVWIRPGIKLVEDTEMTFRGVVDNTAQDFHTPA